MNISEIKCTAPESFESEVQKKVYEVFAQLGIAFERVDNEPAVTMEACDAIAAKLGCPIVKTLLLCNRQQTNFYLFVMPGDKPFSTKNFGQALGISRVSFASAELLYQMVQCPVGGTSVLSTIIDPEHRVQVVLDSEAISGEWFGCNDCTTTSYMKIRTADMLRYLQHTGHEPKVIGI